LYLERSPRWVPQERKEDAGTVTLTLTSAKENRSKKSARRSCQRSIFSVSARCPPCTLVPFSFFAKRARTSACVLFFCEVFRNLRHCCSHLVGDRPGDRPGSRGVLCFLSPFFRVIYFFCVGHH
ncbi:unnamed protein product, partial [Ectocarpus sp. 12 AP-2014]